MATSYTFTTTTITSAIDNTEIKYDRITKDFAILVDGVAVAYGRNYSEAEQKRTAYLADRHADGYFATATELDGGCPDCDPPNEPGPLGPDEGDTLPRACANCKDPHHTWQCPQIGDLLFAEPVVVVVVVDVEYAPFGFAA